MAVFAFASASGSPGVTTTVLACGCGWPRPVVVVEADPIAGSPILAGYFQGMAEPPGSMVDLMVAHRQDQLAERLASVLVPIQGTEVKVLTGVQTRAQAAGLPALAGSLLRALRELEDTGTDVLVDAGRLPAAGPFSPLVLGSDVLLLVTGSNVPGTATARALVTDLTEQRPTGVGLIVVGPSRPYRAKEVAGVLGLPLVGQVEWDPRAAAVWSQGEQPTRQTQRSAFQRSVRATGEAIRDFAGAVSSSAPQALRVGGV